MLIGVAMALLASLGWAVSSILIKHLAGKIDTLSINTIRLWIGSSMLLSFIVVSGRSADLFDIPMHSLGYVLASGILAMAIGDTLYIKSLALLDASIAFPIAQCAFVVTAGLAAILWLDEPYTWITLAGAILVLAGIYLIASEENGDAKSRGFQTISRAGVIVTLGAAFIWTASTIALKIGAEGIDAFVVAAIRISIATLVLTVLALLRRNKGTLQFRQYGVRNLLLVAAAGITTYVVASVAYVLAIQMIGAGKTVLLTASSPLFALPFAILFLKERPTRSTIAGVVVSVCGVYLVVM
jgi:drug/metabolite transporter (DMT)-like permease